MISKYSCTHDIVLRTISARRPRLGQVRAQLARVELDTAAASENSDAALLAKEAESRLGALHERAMQALRRAKAAEAVGPRT